MSGAEWQLVVVVVRQARAVERVGLGPCTPYTILAMPLLIVSVQLFGRPRESFFNPKRACLRVIYFVSVCLSHLHGL